MIDVVTLEPSATVDVHAARCVRRELCETRLVVDDTRVLVDSILWRQPLALWAVRLRRELVRRLPEGAADDLLAVRAIADLAAAHGTPLTADRVDRPEQLAAVIEAGVQLAWGDALELPLSAAELIARSSF